MFYGDNTRWFIATVKAFETGTNSTGRVKIRIHGLHTELVEDQYLPWADTLLPTTEGGSSGIGKIPQIQPYAQVFGIFLDGETSQSPLVLGVMTKDETPSTVQRSQIFDSRSVTVVPESNTGTSNVRPQDYPPVNLNQNLITLFDEGRASVDTRRMIVMQHMINNGLSAKAAAGVTGNIETESTFNPLANRNDPPVENSWGLAQWNDISKNKPSRFEQLKNYAATQDKRPGKSWEDFFVQLNFLIVDMKSNPWEFHRVYERLSNDSIAWDYKGPKNDFNSTHYFQRKYEIGTNYSLRETNAEKAYVQYQRSIKTNQGAR